MKLKELLNESNKDKAALDFLSGLVKKGPFKGKVFLAGGAPRDMQMGLDPKDLDVLVTGGPSAGLDFAIWATKEIGNYKEGSNPVIFPKFFTAKFTLKGVTHNGVDLSDVDVEAVAPRKEKYTPGSRKPEVSAGDIGDDVKRRDFTANSLLHDLSTGETLDLTGMGKDDIKRGLIRTPLDPDIIFSDDPLRILRAVRFTAKYNWKLPMFMVRALKKNAPQLKNISRERIHDEVNKMLLTDYPTKAFRLLRVLGLIPYIFPDITDRPKEKYNLLGQLPKELPVRLAGLFVDEGSADMAEKNLLETKYSLEVIKDVTTILDNFSQLFDQDATSDEAVRRMVRELGLKDYELVLRFAKGYSTFGGLSLNADELAHKAKEQAQVMAQNPLPITGQDLIQLGMKPGPRFKDLLGVVKNMYIKNPNTSKEEYLDAIRQRM